MKDIGGFVRSRIDYYYKNNVNLTNYGGIVQLNMKKGNELLYEAIGKDEPFSLIRPGLSEFNLYHETLCMKWYPKSWRRDMMTWIPTLGNCNEIKKYCLLSLEGYKSADCIACFYRDNKEAVLIEKYASSKAIGFSNGVLNPFFMDNPWTHALKKKKVLIISPFSRTVEKQYKRINKVFPNGFMPEFDLKTIQSVWWAGDIGFDSRFKSWFEVFEYLKREIDKVDFNTALLSCSYLGTPLCDYIKKIGKQAIYVGGGLQLFFGIRGERWENPKNGFDFYQKLVNEYWVKPDESERPEGWRNLEGGCYF